MSARSARLSLWCVKRNELCGTERRTAVENEGPIRADRLSSDRQSHHAERSGGCLDEHRRPIEDLTGRAQPGTEGGAVRCRLMVRMMEGMRDGLDIDQPAQKEQAER